MDTATADQGNAWTTNRAVARFLDMDPGTVSKLVAKGLIRRREIPGMRPQLNMDDARRFAQSQALSPV